MLRQLLPRPVFMTLTAMTAAVAAVSGAAAQETAPPAEAAASHQTAFGQLVPICATTYADARLDSSYFTIPAAVSRTGRAQPLELPAHTVFLHNSAGARRGVGGMWAHALLESGAEIAAGERRQLRRLSRDAAYLSPGMRNSYALLARLSRTQGLTAGADAVVRVDGAFVTARDSGPLSMPMRAEGEGSLIFLTPEYEKNVERMFGAGARELSLPAHLVEGFRAWVTAHEIGHARDERLRRDKSADALSLSEARADILELRRYYTDEFAAFVFDSRALSALNARGFDPDTHHSHVFRDRMEAGDTPSDAELAAARAAPAQMKSAMLLALRYDLGTHDFRLENDPGLAQLESDTPFRLALVTLLQARGAFDEIPLGRAFAQDYIAAAQRRYAPGVLARSRAWQQSLQAQFDTMDAVDARAAERLQAVLPGWTAGDMRRNIDSPYHDQLRMASFRLLHAQGAFDDIGGGAAFVARHLTRLADYAQAQREGLSQVTRQLSRDMAAAVENIPAASAAPIAQGLSQVPRAQENFNQAATPRAQRIAQVASRFAAPKPAATP